MKTIFLFLLVLFGLSACNNTSTYEKHPEFKTYFDEYQVEGSFLLYSFHDKKTIVYNEKRCAQGFLPASTFKILNTLIGLETGIIPDNNFVIPWDSVPRQIPVWNRDHNLSSAFQNSVVPWYQELARRIGFETMDRQVKVADFGNMDVQQDNIDLFWLSGKSRITSFEQLDFQKRFIQEKLPFSEQDIDLVKNIMILDQTPEYILSGKTGWAVMKNKNIGWLVGYLEKEGKIYAYVINVESADEDSTLFRKSRLEIVRKIFKHLSLV